MTEVPFTPMGGDPRWIGRAMRRGVRGELIKRLAELIKNADDAYDRLELRGEKTNGIIEVAYDMIKSEGGKNYSPKGFLVRDFGSGMSTETATKAYYGNNYGSDTSGETRNGAIGVGGKDCFTDMETCFILTVNEKTLTVIELETQKSHGLLASRVLVGKDTEEPLEFANKLLAKGDLEPISLSKNQTLAMFRLPDNVSGSSASKLGEQLRQFYTLRWILESKTRTVKLTDLVNSKTVILKHVPIQSEPLFEKKFEIPFNQVPYEVKIEFRKAEEELLNGHDTQYGYGILIETGRGAILDNQMYGFKDDSAATKLFGKVIFNDWKKLYRESEGQVLTDNREGLDYKHPTNKILQTYILTHLKPLILIEKEKQGDNPQLDKDLDANIKKAFNYMNKMIDKKPIIDLPPIFSTPPAGIEFEAGSYIFAERKAKLVKLYVNPGKVPTNSEISLSLIGNGITIKPESTVTTPVLYDSEHVPFVEIEVIGKELSDGKETVTTLKAVYGELEAETEIHIKLESAQYPKNGFSFVPTKTAVIPKKDRKIKLVIDTNLIAVGSPITLTCNDERMNFSPRTLTVSGPPNIGRYLTEEIITLSSTKVGLKAKLTAETETKMEMLQEQATSEYRTSVCEIEVKEKEPPKTFFKGYELDKKGDKRVRSRFKRDEGIVYIHVNAPILKYTFGGDQQHLKKGQAKPEALTLLADTIVNRMTFEFAKHQIETGQIDVLGEETEAIETQKGIIEYEVGLHLLQTLVLGYAKHDKDL